ncbi:hypothetical protein ABTH55_17755, partial [Acinetobacter baumannii]
YSSLENNYYDIISMSYLFLSCTEKKQYATRNKVSASRTSNKRVVSPAKATAVKPKTAPAATVNKSKSSPFDPLIK